MTKAEIEEYIDIREEIKDLERRIEKRNSERVVDTVKSSMPDYPYTAHTQKIIGVMSDCDLRDKRLTLQEDLKRREMEVENFIESLPKSKDRRIVRYRVLDGLSWPEVSHKMGRRYTPDSVRIRYNRIFEKNF